MTNTTMDADKMRVQERADHMTASFEDERGNRLIVRVPPQVWTEATRPHLSKLLRQVLDDADETTKAAYRTVSKLAGELANNGTPLDQFPSGPPTSTEITIGGFETAVA